MKEKWYYYLVIVSLVVFVGIIYVGAGANNVDLTQVSKTDISKTDIQNEVNTKIEESTLIIYVCGAVENEAVYELKEGARVFQVIELAGGLTDEADTQIINQARLLRDGEMIYFPTKEEVKNGTFTIEDTAINRLININNATEEKLMQLPGIGQVKAINIIKHRNEHGKFESIEDIMQVTGIKEGLYYTIKDFISVK